MNDKWDSGARSFGTRRWKTLMQLIWALYFGGFIIYCSHEQKYLCLINKSSKEFPAIPDLLEKVPAPWTLRLATALHGS